MDEIQDAIRVYFAFGLRHKHILECLAHINGFVISIRTLRRHLKSLRLFRRKNTSDILEVALFLTKNVSEGKTHGYKMHHLSCIQSGFVVTQDTVREILHVIDPEGVELRRRHRLRRRMYSNPGPNFMWHIDSYDKLKPYGLCINGCIDGFSRHIIWMQVYTTSSDPAVIGGYFMDAVKLRMDCPKRVRTDRGTENKHVENFQMFLREGHADSSSNNPFIYGSSNHNQRIESWWSFFRKHCTQHWMNTFQDMKDCDMFTGDFMDRNVVHFCFLNLIQYIACGSLEQLLANKEVELPWRIRINISLDMAQGMSYLHSRGVFHRDFTSKNVLIKTDDNLSYTAVVADFGLAAKIPDPLNNNCRLSIVGSPYWMAPEVLKGENYNEKADVFSYGIILCEITARIEADPDILPRTQHFGLDYIAFCEMVEYCPLDFLQLAFRCCQIDPKKRPSFDATVDNMEMVQQNLNNDLNNQEVKDSPAIGEKRYKRSRSEDNILQANESNQSEGERDHSNKDIFTVTPQIIGEAMSKNDPFYTPATTNPFAANQKFQEGRKLLGTPKDPYSYAYDLPSPSSNYTPPCTPRTNDGTSRPRGNSVRMCQSLPSSPVLLRRAAGRLHQESLHGSISKSLSITTKSKTNIFAECLAQKLSFADTLPDNGQSELKSEPDALLANENVIPLKSSVTESTPQLRRPSRRRPYRQCSVECSLLSFPESRSESSHNEYDEWFMASSSFNDDYVINPSVSHQTPSRSSSDSFMSIDEVAISPTSSISSYSEVEISEVYQTRTETVEMRRKYLGDTRIPEIRTQQDSILVSRNNPQTEWSDIKPESPVEHDIKQTLSTTCDKDHKLVNNCS